MQITLKLSKILIIFLFFTKIKSSCEKDMLPKDGKYDFTYFDTEMKTINDNYYQSRVKFLEYKEKKDKVDKGDKGDTSTMITHESFLKEGEKGIQNAITHNICLLKSNFIKEEYNFFKNDNDSKCENGNLVLVDLNSLISMEENFKKTKDSTDTTGKKVNISAKFEVKEAFDTKLIDDKKTELNDKIEKLKAYLEKLEEVRSDKYVDLKGPKINIYHAGNDQKNGEKIVGEIKKKINDLLKNNLLLTDKDGNKKEISINDLKEIFKVPFTNEVSLTETYDMTAFTKSFEFSGIKDLDNLEVKEEDEKENLKIKFGVTSDIKKEIFKNQILDHYKSMAQKLDEEKKLVNNEITKLETEKNPLDLDFKRLTDFNKKYEVGSQPEFKFKGEYKNMQKYQLFDTLTMINPKDIEGLIQNNPEKDIVNIEEGNKLNESDDDIKKKRAAEYFIPILDVIERDNEKGDNNYDLFDLVCGNPRKETNNTDDETSTTIDTDVRIILV